jgi:ABC-type transport system involved in multi-copper enzyme maturation permease subunit
MSSILTIALLTIWEARRKRVLVAALLCALGFIAVFAFPVFLVSSNFEGHQPLRRQFDFALLTVFGLFGANFLSVLFAILLPIDTLSGDIDSGVMQTLASKPIRRADIVVGKWLGHWTIVIAYMMVICGAVLIMTSLGGRSIRINALALLPCIVLELTFMLTVAIAGGTRLSTVTNGVLALGVYGIAFIGGWMEQLGTLAGLPSVSSVGVAASLISPGDAMWRLGAYLMQPDIVRGQELGPFVTASVPNALMVWWAIALTALTLVYAVRAFERRAL